MRPRYADPASAAPCSEGDLLLHVRLLRDLPQQSLDGKRAGAGVDAVDLPHRPPGDLSGAQHRAQVEPGGDAGYDIDTLGTVHPVTVAIAA